MSVFDTRQTIHRGDDGAIRKAHRTAPGDVKVFYKDTDDAEDVPHVRVPVSSTTRDRDGDNFDEGGVEHMLEQLSSGEVPVFLDHGVSPETGFQDYRALEAIGGWVDGEKDGDVLHGIAALDPDKEQAQELISTLENGVVPMGWSVGFRPTEKSDRDDGGFVFEAADLLEVSAVGIPSNPDAVSASIVATAKGFGARKGVELDPDELSKGLDDVFERAAAAGEERAIDVTLDVLEEYRDATDEDERELRDFVDYAHEERAGDALAVTNATERYVDEYSDADDEPGIKTWLEQQRDADSDDDEDEDDEKGDGDDEDDEDDDKSPTSDVVTLSDESVERLGETIVSGVREPLVEAVESATPDVTDDGDGDSDDDEDDDDKSPGSVGDRPPARQPKGFGSAAGDESESDEKDTDSVESDSDAPTNGLVFGRDLTE